MSKTNVFFLRGLSTYGYDNARFSVFDFGPMYQHLQHELEKRGINFYPILGLGAGPLREVAERGIKILKDHPVWRDSSKPVHLLGHSAGGLVARLILEALKEERRILSCVTIASPHRGAKLAQIALDIPDQHPRSKLFFSMFRYDIKSKGSFFKELTPQGIEQIFSSSPWQDPRFASIVCASPRSEWCPPLRFLHSVTAFKYLDCHSDGMVEAKTQNFGKVIGEIGIDHIRQVGLFNNRPEFTELCDLIAEYFKSI